MNEMKFIELKKALKDTVEEMVRVLYELRKEKEFNESLRFRAINIYAKFKSLYLEIKSETAGGTMLYNLNMLISLGLFKVKYIFYFILAIIFSMKIDIKSNEKVYNVLLIILFIYVISIMVTGSYNPFIYFRF